MEHGVDMIEHGGSMSDATIELLLERKAYICTTFSPVVLQAQNGLEWGVPEWKVEERKRSMADKSQYDGLVRAARAGVPIVFGTDAGSPVVPHDAIASELKFMVEVGVCSDNEDALVSLTSRSAEMNGVADDRGSLEESKAADVVVVGGDAVADLDAIDDVRAVYLDGVKVA
jgi:imidazolonepropionase-like amidohydrolase